MENTTLRIEFGTNNNTVYVVNQNYVDVVAVPVLFKENMKTMAELAWKVAIKK